MMLTPKLDRFVDQFVLGSIVVAGGWYLHRPFWLVYFPNLAPDRAGGAGQLDLELALLMCAIGSICAGVIINHISDVATVALFRDEAASDKSARTHRLWLRRAGRIFTLWPTPDPRVRAIRRYLASSRRERFLAMMSDWALTDAPRLQQSSECVIAHQHVVVHMRVASPATKAAIDELYAPVTFAGSMFVVACSLVLISALSFWTSSLVESVRQVQPNRVKFGIAAFLYVGALLTGVSFRRRFRDFCSSILTTALHFHSAQIAADVNKPN